MKLLFFLIVSTLILLRCGNTASPDHNQLQPEQTLVKDSTVKDMVKPGDSIIHPENLFTVSDAEIILGETALLTDSSSALKENVAKYNCAFFAKSTDEKTGKTGSVYFMFEQYGDTASAAKEYASIKKSNEDHEGVKTLQQLGDEAYFHSDGKNFYFILVRKAEKMFRLKVNKITSKTPVESFNNVAKKITDDLNIVWAPDD